MSDIHHRVPAVDDKFAELRLELSSLSTEAINHAFTDLDLRGTEELVLAMNDEDASVPAAVRTASPQIARAVDAISERMRHGGRLIYVGAGTSGRLGVLDASECPPTFDIDPSRVRGIIAGGDDALRNSIEAAEDSETAGSGDMVRLRVGADDVVVGIAASGRTPYVVGALKAAASVSALTVAVACNRDSRIGAIADIPIEVVVGAEFIAGSTRLKAGTAEKLVLNMLSTLTMVRLGKTYGNIMIDLRATNEKLRARAQQAVMTVTGRGFDDVARAISAAGGSAKVATLVLLGDLNAESAKRLLAETDGNLRSALDRALRSAS